MTEMSPTIDRAACRLADVLTSLDRVTGDVRVAGQLLALLGWDLPPGVDDIGLTRVDVSRLVAQTQQLAALRR